MTNLRSTSRVSFAVSVLLICVYSLMLALVPPSQLTAAPSTTPLATDRPANPHIHHVNGTDTPAGDPAASLQ